MYELINNFLQENKTPVEELYELKDIYEEFDDSELEFDKELESDSESYIEYK